MNCDRSIRGPIQRAACVRGGGITGGPTGSLRFGGSGGATADFTCPTRPAAGAGDTIRFAIGGKAAGLAATGRAPKGGRAIFPIGRTCGGGGANRGFGGDG